ncbi:MAG TPA: tetratricopeptide repeat protein [Kiritimatiellia bacterium]|nr:tetratricopeptide repeat protein [Kiritimatiellia bacterium]
MKGTTSAIRPLVAKPYAHRPPEECLVPEFAAVVLSISSNRRDSERAARLCQDLLCLPGAPVELLYWLALARRCQGLHEQAEAAVMEALVREPDYACAWWLRGRLCMDRGAAAEGGPFMCRAIALEPIYAHAWLSLSRTHELSGQLEGVFTALRYCLDQLRATHSLEAWHSKLLVKISQQRKPSTPLRE